MPVYKNNPAQFPELRKQIIAKLLPLLAITVLGALSICYFSNSDNPTDFRTILFVMALYIVILAYGVNKNIKTQKKLFDSYLLKIEHNYLLTEKNGFSNVQIFFSDIESITQDKQGNLLVKGQKSGEVIAVPQYLDGYEDVKNKLNHIKPITIRESKNIFQKFPLLMPVLVIGLMGAVYISNNKILVLLSGLLLLGFMIWSFISIRKARQIDEKIKKMSWWLILVFFSVIAIIYYKVFVV